MLLAAAPSLFHHRPDVFGADSVNYTRCIGQTPGGV